MKNEREKRNSGHNNDTKEPDEQGRREAPFSRSENSETKFRTVMDDYLDAEREEIRKEVREKGRKEGCDEGREEIARNMPAMNYNWDDIIKITGISYERLRELAALTLSS